MVASLALRFLVVALSVVVLLSLLLVASLALRLLVVALSEVASFSCSRCSWWPRSRFAS